MRNWPDTADFGFTLEVALAMWAYLIRQLGSRLGENVLIDVRSTEEQITS